VKEIASPSDKFFNNTSSQIEPAKHLSIVSIINDK
jgi:hypothetical protein